MCILDRCHISEGTVAEALRQQAPEAICNLVPVNVNRNVMMNRDMPPLNDPDLRRAMALSLDRKAFVDTLTLGKGDLGGVMQPPPEGIWGMPPEMLRTLPGYDPDVQRNRVEARQIMEKARLPVEQAAFDQGVYAQPRAVPGCGDNLIDQLKEIYVDGIADIYLDGAISEVATRRSEFSAILKNKGVDGLIAALDSKADALISR